MELARLAVLPVLLCLCAAVTAAAPASAPAGVELSLPMLPETIPGQAEERTCVVVRVQRDGQARDVVLGVAADTYLWKGATKPASGKAWLALRDNRFCVGLAKLDLSALAAGETIDSAVFRAKAGGSERPGNCRLQFHRMLVDWDESATWLAPSSAREDNWDGPRAGKDYEDKPFVTWQIDEWKKGSTIEANGFGKAVQAWQSGQWPNHGFVILMWGKSLQVGMAGRDAQAEKAKTLTLGGPGGASVILPVNVPLLKRALLSDADLLEVRLSIHIPKWNNAASGASLQCLAAPAQGGPATKPVGQAVLASLRLDAAPADGRVELAGLAPYLRETIRSGQCNLLLRLEGDAKASLPVSLSAAGKDQPVLRITIAPAPHARLYEHPLVPRAGVYCTLRGGHLYYGDQRLRLWGEVGYGAADRKRAMGFNCDRLWSCPEMYDEVSVKQGKPKAADGNVDKFDSIFAELKKQQMFIMYAGLTSSIPLAKYREALLADDSFIAGGEDWQAWKDAVTHDANGNLLPPGKIGIEQYRLTVLDERLRKLRFAHAANILNHVNPLTGKAYGQDESIVIHEIFNELGFVKWAVEGGLDKIPAFFRDQTRRKWNAWLLKRCGGEEKLKVAWGRLERGESLSAGTVALGPALAGHNDMPEQRGRDFVRFLIETLDEFNQAFRAHCRAQAPKGVGVNVCPFSFDTQYRPSIPWAYTNSRGDVNCFGMYFWGVASELARPPSMYVIDSHSVEGCATVLYETNQSRPSPYRTEYPIRIATLAAWQDWDGVIFHYWGGLVEEGTPDEAYMIHDMPHVNRSHYWMGVHHANDPVMCSSLAIAGRAFLSGAIAPAPSPAIYRVGGRAIFGYDAVNGVGMAGRTFSPGSRIRFVPDSNEGVTLDGASPPPAQRLTGAIAAGEQTLWDWPNGRMIVDTPTFKAYVGKTAGTYRFRDGIAISDVSAPWVCFALSSADGKPLADANCHRMHLAAVADARNTGFAIDPAFTGGGPFETSDAIRNRGRAPVVVDPVGYTLHLPTQARGKFTGYDFALRKCAEQPLEGSRLVRAPADLYMGILEIASRGEPAKTPPTTLVTVIEVQPTTQASTQSAQASQWWEPVPGLTWGMGAPQAHKVLRESTLVFTSISKIDEAQPPQASFTLYGAQALWNLPADITLTFGKTGLGRIAFTFKRPPALTEAVATYEKLLGTPLEKRLARQEEVSKIRWQAKAGNDTFEVIVTEAQGTLTVSYEKR